MSFMPPPRPSKSSYIPLDSATVHLRIRQNPEFALVTNENKEKGRKGIDPPPIVQLHVDAGHETNELWLVNPYLFMMAMIVDAKTEQMVNRTTLVGQNTSSLNRLKDLDAKDAGFFIFHDMSCRKTGTYKLQFNLYDYDRNTGAAILVKSIASKEFKVLTQKEFKGLSHSSHLSRHFSDQGVRLRLRKEPRAAVGTKRAWTRTSPVHSTQGPFAGLYAPTLLSQTNCDEAPLKRQRTSHDYSTFGCSSYSTRAPITFGTNPSADPSTWSTTAMKSLPGDPPPPSTQSMADMMASAQGNSLWERGTHLTGLDTSTLGSSTSFAAPIPSSYYHSETDFATSNYFSSAVGTRNSAGYPPQKYVPSSENPVSNYKPLPHVSTSLNNDGYSNGLRTPTSITDHPLSASIGQSSGNGGALNNSGSFRHSQSQSDLRESSSTSNPYAARALDQSLSLGLPSSDDVNEVEGEESQQDYSF